jgi:aldehyde:ferredoxin oxidoreductase
MSSARKEKMVYGWMGKVLRVDLTSGRIEKRPLPEEAKVKYIGGRGINVRMLYDEVKAGTDGLAPENALIFGTGPLTGTMLASGRTNVTAMSPLTRILGDCNGGSNFSPEVKFAGYDHILFTGKADKPVYLWIENDRVELKDARHLWGKATDETQGIIKGEKGDPEIQIACIGPAGENLVRMAGVLIGVEGFGGKSGIGAVMGSKNLKAVAVRGTKGVKVAHPETFAKLAKKLIQRLQGNSFYPLFSSYGTPMMMMFKHISATQTFHNAQQTGVWSGYDEVCHETLLKKYWGKYKSCFGCPLHCRHFYEIKDGPYRGLKGIGFELATQNSWGALCDNPYTPSLFQAYSLCQRYGLDQSECGQVVAAAMEWFEKGIITKKDTEGVELRWGNYEAIIKMVHKIARKEGIGELLSQGGAQAAAKLGRGAEKAISHSKGQMRTTGDLRTAPTYMIGQATSTRGGDHLRGTVPFSTMTWEDEGLVRSVYDNQCVCTIADSLEICKFNTTYINMEMGLKEMGEFFSAATGIPTDEAELRCIADRIWNLERAFIVREGITRKDDVMHGRYMDEPVHGGSCDGLAVNRERWNQIMDEYCDLNGWDKETGIPTRKSLEALGLKDVVDDLERLGKLSIR